MSSPKIGFDFTTPFQADIYVEDAPTEEIHGKPLVSVRIRNHPDLVGLRTFMDERDLLALDPENTSVAGRTFSGTWAKLDGMLRSAK